MKEIVERLTENRNIERAKSILESNGYEVSKRLKDSCDTVEDCIERLEPSKASLSAFNRFLLGLAST